MLLITILIALYINNSLQTATSRNFVSSRDMQIPSTDGASPSLGLNLSTEYWRLVHSGLFVVRITKQTDQIGDGWWAMVWQSFGGSLPPHTATGLECQLVTMISGALSQLVHSPSFVGCGASWSGCLSCSPFADDGGNMAASDSFVGTPRVTLTLCPCPDYVQAFFANCHLFLDRLSLSSSHLRSHFDCIRLTQSRETRVARVINRFAVSLKLLKVDSIYLLHYLLEIY